MSQVHLRSPLSPSPISAAPPASNHLHNAIKPFRPSLPWLIIVVALFLCLYALNHSSLWSDEGNTWALIQRSWPEIARDAAADIHPPGYYWLLKLWSLLLGSSAAAMRAFSVLAGTLLVLLVYQLARQIERARPIAKGFALAAAWLAALNPFLIYYSQEARMYMLLALATVGLYHALLAWMARERVGQPVRWAMAAFIAWGALGLWTHYSFPIVPAAAGLAYLWHWRRGWGGSQPGQWQRLARYGVANLLMLLTFAPWLPTAIQRVLAWPQGGELVSMGAGLRLTLQTLTFGPLRDLPEPLIPWLVVAALLPLLGCIALIWVRRGSPAHDDTTSGVTLGLWLAAPIALMFGLGLFSDAFLKFLLTAAPAWLLLTAAAPLLLSQPAWGQLALAIGGLVLASLTLPGYYHSPTARDNYAGVARYISVMGDPTSDLVLLDAPGQSDVWRYYDPGVPVIGLPTTRPPDADATVVELANAVADRRQVFALFWATDEADPARIVESWLDQQAFRGPFSWQGNLRFVVYALPNQLACRELTPAASFGPAIVLTAHCQPAHLQQVTAGQVALVGLRWQTSELLTTRYMVTVQLLDARNQVIAQHDVEPAGGSRPTDSWQVDEEITDNHGLPVPIGAPPGVYRLVVALYDATTGVRLPTVAGDALELGQIEVMRPAAPLPLDIVDMRVRSQSRLGPLILAGYDLHRKDYSHAPETPVANGDLVHFTFWWQAPAPLPPDWPEDAQFTLRLGTQTLTAPLTGGLYPTGAWQAGELVRGEFDLTYDGSDAVPSIEIEGQTLRLQPVPR